MQRRNISHNDEKNRRPEDSKVVGNEKKEVKLTFFEEYQELMQEYPFLMNACQSALINCCSVIVSQWINLGRPKFFEINYHEVVVMMIIGALYVTPVLLVFYHYLGKMTVGGDLGKLFVDQFLFSPLFTAGLITLRLVLLGEDEDLVSTVLHVTPIAMKTSWLFWIPQRFFTLRYLPPVYHLVFGNLCALIWNVIFTLILNNN